MVHLTVINIGAIDPNLDANWREKPAEFNSTRTKLQQKEIKGMNAALSFFFLFFSNFLFDFFVLHFPTSGRHFRTILFHHFIQTDCPTMNQRRPLRGRYRRLFKFL